MKILLALEMFLLKFGQYIGGSNKSSSWRKHQNEWRPSQFFSSYNSNSSCFAWLNSCIASLCNTCPLAINKGCLSARLINLGNTLVMCCPCIIA